MSDEESGQDKLTLSYMPLHIWDYLGDTQHLTTVEHGAYLLLIMTYWMRKKPLPDNDRRLASIVKLTLDEWSSVRETLCEMFVIEGGEWRHKRIDEELTKALGKVQKLKGASRAGVEARRAKAASNGKHQDKSIAYKNDQPDDQPNGEPYCNQTKLDKTRLDNTSSLRSDVPLSPVDEGAGPEIFPGFPKALSPEPSALCEAPPASQADPPKAKPRKAGLAKPDYPGDFEMLWHDYPKSPNCSKFESFKCWERLSADDRDRCFDGMLRYAEWLEAEGRKHADALRRGDRKARPPPPPKHLTTFINQRCFDDFLGQADDCIKRDFSGRA